MQSRGNPPESGYGNASALRRLAQARAEQARLIERREEAKGTAAEAAASRRLDAGNADVVAREAWLEWADRTPDW
jgi:hypothetical protein